MKVDNSLLCNVETREKSYVDLGIPGTYEMEYLLNP